MRISISARLRLQRRAAEHLARPFAQILAICLGSRQQRLFLGIV
jgi:hypothetical protein